MAELTEKGFRPYYIYGNEFGQGNEWPPMKAYEEAYEEILSWEKKLRREAGLYFSGIQYQCNTIRSDGR